MGAVDVTNEPGASAQLSKTETAALDRLAPNKLVLARTESAGFVSDVRLISGGIGFIAGTRTSFLEYSFTTVLEDGFVVGTDAVVGGGAAFARFAVQTLDPGLITPALDSLEAARDLHEERVRAFVEKRKSPERHDHDRTLYFEFRRVRSKQILTLALFQFIPIMVVLPVIMLVHFHTPGVPKEASLASAALFVAVSVASFLVGTLVYKVVRGNKPMLQPRVTV